MKVSLPCCRAASVLKIPALSSDETQTDPETCGSHKAVPYSWKEKHKGVHRGYFAEHFWLSFASTGDKRAPAIRAA